MQVFSSIVSIPVGFFQALQLRCTDCEEEGIPVSIPVGFFQALQQYPPWSGRAVQVRFNPCRVFSGLATVIHEANSLLVQFSFNPCRVFSGLATSIGGRNLYPRERFNPCRVFSGLATEANRIPELYYGAVSIPVGFFQALQPTPHRLLLRPG